MILGIFKQFFVKTGTIQEKRISLTFIAKYRGIKQKTNAIFCIYFRQCYRAQKSVFSCYNPLFTLEYMVNLNFQEGSRYMSM